jgi:hypothetical protein
MAPNEKPTAYNHYPCFYFLFAIKPISYWCFGIYATTVINQKCKQMVDTTMPAEGSNFVKSFLTQQGITRFSFLRNETVPCNRYYVFVVDRNLKTFWFVMHMQGGKWRIGEVENVPKWISLIEELLAAAINEVELCAIQ